MELNLKKNPRYYLFIIILVVVLVGFWLGQAIYLPKDRFAQEEVIFSIENGEGLKEIASHLKEKGLIKSKAVFMTYAFLSGRATSLLAGDYRLAPAMSIAKILKKFSSGDIAKERITVIEGSRAAEIANLLKEKGLVEKEQEFLAVLQLRDWQPHYEFLKEIRLPGDWQIEGFLFPDTYEILPGTSAQEIVEKMLDNFEKKVVAELKEEIIESNRTLFKIVTMASIVEREVKTYQEKQTVAGILWKRKRSGWPLQVDATLTYITGKSSAELTREDLEIDSPYNTYIYYGLPYGPIGNPGLESIKACLDYQENDFWFYLTTPGEDEVIFSKTLAEHNAARRKYLK